MGSLKPLLQPAGQGRLLNVIGNPIRLIISGRDTGGTFALVESSDPANGPPAPGNI